MWPYCPLPRQRHAPSPSRVVGGIDNLGSHFYLAMRWARALAD